MKQYIVDAFTDRPFSGNPAAVIVPEEWPSDKAMQNIAIENNLSETAFAVKDKEGYRLRWFTPGGEIDFCGHATLATAFVIMNYYDKSAEKVIFNTMKGKFTVTRDGDLYSMNFPAYELQPLPVTDMIADAVGIRPVEVYIGRGLLCVLETEEQVRRAAPDIEKVKTLDGLLLHITARGGEYDCVSRSFAPKLNVTEDPVCGSGHCHIIPYWSSVLGKSEITAYQASARGGVLFGKIEGERVVVSGKAVLFSISNFDNNVLF